LEAIEIIVVEMQLCQQRSKAEEHKHECTFEKAKLNIKMKKFCLISINDYPTTESFS